MPVVEKTSGGRVNVRGIGEFVPGDQAEVSRGDAEYLLEERNDFELVEDGNDAEEEPDSDDTVDEAEVDFVAEDDWLDRDYQDRADAVAAGEADGFLDTVEEYETSETVIDAVQERRDELEG
jgi:hypothetical protein